MSTIGLNVVNVNYGLEPLLEVKDVIARLEIMSPMIELEDFDTTKKADEYYCVEWGIKKGQWMEQNVLERYIRELKALL